MFETFIVNPLITVLALLYSLFGNNIVIAIAVLTIAIRLATSPLLIKQQQTTTKMQELQPRLKKLQEKYKNDRERLAQEQMKLYREMGVNPLGGCLPLFIQLPILIALYQAIILGLASSPFQVVDLSDRLLLPGMGNLVPLQNMFAGMDLTLPPTSNPAYALAFPVLVFITTWMQSKLTIPAPKPNEKGELDQTAQMTRTMTTIMPIMFAFFSLSFSVGLSIYFVVSNLVGIVQYTLMGRAKWGRLFGQEEEDSKAPAVVKGQATAAAVAGDGGGTTQQLSPKAQKRKTKKMRARENRK
jgi:YidC/Oxa1 family membrane protein insertase